jgi:hypothetical protein
MVYPAFARDSRDGLEALVRQPSLGVRRENQISHGDFLIDSIKTRTVNRVTEPFNHPNMYVPIHTDLGRSDGQGFVRSPARESLSMT